MFFLHLDDYMYIFIHYNLLEKKLENIRQMYFYKLLYELFTFYMKSE